MNRLLKVTEAIERLNVSRSHLYELLGQGNFKIVRIGRAIRIPEDEIERFIRDNTEKSSTSIRSWKEEHPKYWKDEDLSAAVDPTYVRP